MIKTSISTTSDIYDVSGQWLPAGNYYFSIERTSNTKVQGMICDRMVSAEYTFKPITVIKMMSAAQARLARRANIVHECMPSAPSPVESQDYPVNFIVSKVSDALTPLPHINPRTNPKSPPEGIMCMICLDLIGTTPSPRVLRCTHSFHTTCINKWLRTRSHCPVCRTSVRVKNTTSRDWEGRGRPAIVNTEQPLSSVRRQNLQREYNQVYAGSLTRFLG